jgi:CMP-N,N'-diacetyllegionaminic acid synthase
MKIYSFIPARGGSKGIPNKNIYPIFGEPLLLYSLKHSINTKANTKTYVSTDSKNIADLSLN